MKKLLILTVFLLINIPTILNCMDPAQASKSEQAAFAKQKQHWYSGWFGGESSSALGDDLMLYFDATTGILNLSARDLTNDTFKTELKKISDFIKSHNVKSLNLENNKFDYVPLELIQLMVSAPSLITASLKGNFNRSKGVSGPVAVLLPEIIKGLHAMVTQLISTAQADIEQGLCVIKIIYLDDNMPPLNIPVSPQMQKTAPSKLKPILLHGLSVIVGIALTEGVNLLSMYLMGWLGNETQSSGCGCP